MAMFRKQPTASRQKVIHSGGRILETRPFSDLPSE
jgi:hypothetical protein